MQVQDITARTMVTTTGRIDQTRRIVCFCPGYYLFGIKLSPGFVERNPDNNRRVRHAQIHDFLPFLVVVGYRFRCTLFVCSTIVSMRRPAVAHVASWHILPYQNTFLVAMIITASRFYFHMLTDHVEAPVFGLLDVEQQGFIGWSGI